MSTSNTILVSVLHMFNAAFQNCIDYLYLKNIKYFPQGEIHYKYNTKKRRLNILNKYLKPDGTYKRSLPIFSALSYLYPKTAESNLKCNAYALNILSYCEEVIDPSHLISYLYKESLYQVGTCSKQNTESINITFNILQVITSFINLKQYALAIELYNCLLLQNINWKNLPLFVRSCFLLVTEQLHQYAPEALANKSEIVELTVDLFQKLNLPYINQHNSFKGTTGYATHELGYLLYFLIQLTYTKTHPDAFDKVLALLNKLHQAFIRDKILIEDTEDATSKVINNSGVALIATVLFIASIKTKDYRYGNAALYLTDYLYALQNRYLGLIPNTIPVWSSKSPLQYPLWTQYYLLLATSHRESFLSTLK